MDRRARTPDDTHAEMLAPLGPGMANGPDSTAPDAADLVARFEREALPFLDRLYAAATCLTRDRGAAAELVQQTYLRAFDAFGSFTTGTNMKAWLFYVLADTAHGADGERQNLPRPSCSPGQPRDRLPGKKHPAPSVPPTAAAQALDLLPDHEVKAALNQLPREIAIVVHLAYVEDFSSEEIAELLGIPPGTAISRLHHGRQRLLRLLIYAARRQGDSIIPFPTASTHAGNTNVRSGHEIGTTLRSTHANP
ncbi:MULTISPECIES: sigma-70 family RNA polymerase sigma factor [Streptomyces]|nr:MULTISPECIES: sigma-70 family RNA polymerase sigma factor [Streptomyces]PIB00376.1 hypothetical protein B1C81_38230 [Streptomyces sp. HG99]